MALTGLSGAAGSGLWCASTESHASTAQSPSFSRTWFEPVDCVWGVCVHVYGLCSFDWLVSVCRHTSIGLCKHEQDTSPTHTLPPKKKKRAPTHPRTRPEALLPAQNRGVVFLPAQQLRVHQVPKVLPPRRRLEEGQPLGLGHLLWWIGGGCQVLEEAAARKGVCFMVGISQTLVPTTKPTQSHTRHTKHTQSPSITTK
jgi:hypothetical protein